MGISEWILDLAKRSTIGSKARIQKVIHYPIAPPPPTSNRSAPPSNRRRKILFGAQSVGNSRKGFQLLLDAWSKHDLRSTCELITFGKINDKIPKTDGVTQMGYIENRKALENLIQDADVFCIPSTEEGFGLTGVEALEVGCPVVCFKNTGCCDYVIQGVTGEVAQRTNSEDLANALVRILGDEANYSASKVSEAYADIWNRSFSIEKCQANYLALYNEMLTV